MSPTNIVAYGSYGSVRGYGPLYARQDQAEESVRRDQQACEAQRGYSDRWLVAVDDRGICYEIDPYDGTIGSWVPGPGGRTSGAARYSDDDLSTVMVESEVSS